MLFVPATPIHTASCTPIVACVKYVIAPARDREGNPVIDGPQRVEQLLRILASSGTAICIPSPVIAEVMALGGKGGSQYLNEMKKSSRFYLAPFDTAAAVEAWELISLIKNQVGNRSKPWSTWAKVKFDCQIAAIAKLHNITRIYSDDKDVFEHGRRMGASVLRVCDLAPVSKPAEEGIFTPEPSLFRSDADPE